MRAWVATICLALGLATAGTATACSCVRYDSAAEQMQDADVVFIGRWISTRPRVGGPIFSRPGEYVASTLQVVRMLRGPVAETIVVHHPLRNDGSCGFEFREFLRDGTTRPLTVPIIVLARYSVGELETNVCAMPRFPTGDYVRAARRRR